MVEPHPAFLWRTPEPKSSYEVVIVGGGGHGLATAYYLAKNHGITDVAVLERGWLAGGNITRNTTVIRSNYIWDESAAIYEHSLKLWEGLEAELDYDLLFSQRGVLNLAHTLQDVRDGRRRVNANRLNGIDAEWLDSAGVAEVCPLVDISPDVRYPVLGATFQPRGGIARHENVAWGYARAADALGVDLLQGCEVTGIDVKDGRAVAVETSLGRIAAGRIGIVAAGHSSLLAAMAGLRIPIQTHPLQALVSELYEDVLGTVVMSNAVHVYVSQAHKGELVMGAGIDPYNSYAQRGSFHVIEHQLAAANRRHDTRCGPLPELRLGDGWIQGDPGFGVDVRVDARLRGAARAERALRARAVRHRRADRRARRCRGRALMLLVRCPWCGERDEVEFSYGGQAQIAYPAEPAAASDEEWAQYLFVRDNPQGLFRERWVHTHGCRRWFELERDTR